MSVVPVAQTVLLGLVDFEARKYLETAFRCSGYSVEVADDVVQLVKWLQAGCSPVGAIVLEEELTDKVGLDLLRETRRLEPAVPIVVIASGSVPPDSLADDESVERIPRPSTLKELWRALRQAIERVAAAASPAGPAPSRMWFGDSPDMRRLEGIASQIASSDAPVLIQGETGTGKEVFARELHALSPRARRPFAKLNCAALPSELVESELFGYERGAFTGAFQRKIGMFEIADRGTLLLDEIGDMDVRLQAKLLQVLQDQTFQRLGGRELISVDVRIIAATHRNLEEAITENRFREDLYYRLNVFKVWIPPLRERPDDILPLAEFLLNRHAEPGAPVPVLPPSVREFFLEYPWPGNIRELENVIRNYLVLHDPDLICRELHAAMRTRAGPSAPPKPSPRRFLKAASGDPGWTRPLGGPEPFLKQVARAKQEAEVAAIVSALHATKWNRRQAATLLEIDYKALLYKIKRLGITKADHPAPIEMPPPEDREDEDCAAG